MAVGGGHRLRGWFCRAFSAMACVMAAAAAPASASEGTADGLALECPRDVVRREPFRCRVRVAPPDDAVARDGFELRIALQGPLLRVSSSPGLVFDHRARAWSWRGDPSTLPQVLEMELVTEDSQGVMQAQVSAAWVDPVREPPREVVQALRIVHHPVPRLRVGGSWLPGAPIVWFAGLLAAEVALLAGAWRWRRRPGAPGFGAVLACIVAGNLSLMLNAGAIDDLRALHRYEASTCEVLDRTEWGNWPLAALRYAAGGRSVASVGFEGRNRFYGKGDGERAGSLEPGARVPCWFDPAHPSIVVVDRSPSLVMWLVGALTLMLWLATLRWAWRSRQPLR